MYFRFKMLLFFLDGRKLGNIGGYFNFVLLGEIIG